MCVLHVPCFLCRPWGKFVEIGSVQTSARDFHHFNIESDRPRMEKSHCGQTHVYSHTKCKKFLQKRPTSTMIKPSGNIF